MPFMTKYCKVVFFAILYVRFIALVIGQNNNNSIFNIVFRMIHITSYIQFPLKPFLQYVGKKIKSRI